MIRVSSSDGTEFSLPEDTARAFSETIGVMVENAGDAGDAGDAEDEDGVIPLPNAESADMQVFAQFLEICREHGVSPEFRVDPPMVHPPLSRVVGEALAALVGGMSERSLLSVIAMADYLSSPVLLQVAAAELGLRIRNWEHDELKEKLYSPPKAEETRPTDAT